MADSEARQPPDEAPAAADASVDGDGAKSGGANGGARKLVMHGLLGLGVTCVLFLVLSRFVEAKRLTSLLAGMRWELALPGFALYALIYAVRAARFRMAVPGTPYRAMYFIACLHNFFLRILPLHTGELAFSVLTRKYGNVTFGQSLVSLVLLRLLDATMVVTLFAATLALNQTIYRGEVGSGIVVAVAVSLFGLVIVLRFTWLMTLGLRIAEWVLGVLRIGRNPKVSRLLEKIGEAITSHADLRRRIVAPAAAVTVLLWLLNYATIFTMMRAFRVQVSVPQAVLGGTAAVVSGFLPLSGIGTFGMLEAGWSLGFSLVGIESGSAVASGIAYSLTTFAFACALGLVGWIGALLYNRNG